MELSNILFQASSVSHLIHTARSFNLAHSLVAHPFSWACITFEFLHSSMCSLPCFLKIYLYKFACKWNSYVFAKNSALTLVYSDSLTCSATVVLMLSCKVCSTVENLSARHISVHLFCSIRMANWRASEQASEWARKRNSKKRMENRVHCVRVCLCVLCISLVCA